MKKTFCSWEKTILEGFNRGHMNPEYQEHLKTCLGCRDALMVRSWMSDFSGIPAKTELKLKKIPNFESIWQGAKADRKYDRELEKKAMTPLLIPQFLTYIAALIGLILLLTANLSQARDVVTNKLKMGYLFDLLSLVGKKMLALMPYLMIPIIFALLLIALHFLYSLFNPKKA